jgi:hypothetical protein
MITTGRKREKASLAREAGRMIRWCVHRGDRPAGAGPAPIVETRGATRASDRRSSTSSMSSSASHRRLADHWAVATPAAATPAGLHRTTARPPSTVADHAESGGVQAPDPWCPVSRRAAPLHDTAEAAASLAPATATPSHSCSTLIRPCSCRRPRRNHRGCVPRLAFRPSGWARRDHDRPHPQACRRTQPFAQERIVLITPLRRPRWLWPTGIRPVSGM